MQGAAQLSSGTSACRDSQTLLMLSIQLGANGRAEMLCDFAHRLASLARCGVRGLPTPPTRLHGTDAITDVDHFCHALMTDRERRAK
jgi:hypothetical protein